MTRNMPQSILPVLGLVPESEYLPYLPGEGPPGTLRWRVLGVCPDRQLVLPPALPESLLSPTLHGAVHLGTVGAASAPPGLVVAMRLHFKGD